MMMSHPLSALTLVWPLVCSLAAALPAQKTGFLDRTVKSGALTIKYQVYVPPTYPSGSERTNRSTRVATAASTISSSVAVARP